MYCTTSVCYATPYQNCTRYQRLDTITGSGAQLNWAYLYDP